MNVGLVKFNARALGWSIALLFGIHSLSKPILAQTDTGSVSGTVTDSSGARVVNANITLLNEETGVERAVQTTKSGTYSFDGVNPGLYTIRFTAETFGTLVMQHNQVDVAKGITADAVLKSGSVNQQIVVGGAASVLQTTDASIGQVIDSTTIDDLPLVTRDWTTLSQLSAGVASLGGAGDASWTANGVNYQQRDFRLNGIDDNVEASNRLVILPPPDAIQEFKLQTGNYSAQYGHSTGAIVNAVLKSGTNSLHGDIWDYFRNDVLDANDYFSNQNGAAKAPYNYNQFGGTIGGPVTLGHFYNGHDRTFFFFDYQGLIYNQNLSFTNSVPTAREVASGFTDLSELLSTNTGTRYDGLGRLFPIGTVFDPATTRTIAVGAIDPISGLTNNLPCNYPVAVGSTPAAPCSRSVRDPFYTGSSVYGVTDFTTPAQNALMNQIPVYRMDPLALALLKLYPSATSSGTIDNNFARGSDVTHTNQIDFRADHNISSRDIAFGVFSWTHTLENQPGALPGIAIGQRGGVVDTTHYAIALSETHVLTPSLLNQAWVGFTHSIDNTVPLYANTMGIPQQFGIQGVPQNSMNGGLPTIDLGSLTGLGASTYSPTLSMRSAYEYSDNLSKGWRSHQFDMGAQFYSIETDTTQPVDSRGLFSYAGQYTSLTGLNNSINGLSDMLVLPIQSLVGGTSYLGGAGTVGGSNLTKVRYHRYYEAAYIQDNWKATSRLTLDLGVRYDHFSPYKETEGKFANFIPSSLTASQGSLYIPTSQCNAPSSASFQTLLVKDNINIICSNNDALGDFQNTNFAPRVGAAFRAKTNLIFRAGYAISYGGLDSLGFGPTLGNNYPFSYSSSYSAGTFSGGALLSNSLAQINLGSPLAITGKYLVFYGREWNFKTAYTESLNFFTQLLVHKSHSIEVGYVGNLGRHLDNFGANNANFQILPPTANNQALMPFPDFSKGIYQVSNGVSSYHALQAIYQHRFAQGWSMLANYTFSKCLSDQSTNSSALQYRAPNVPGFGVRQDYTFCDSDVTHVIHVSGSYDLPFGHNRLLMSHANRPVELLAGGWSTSYNFVWQTGRPFTVSCPIRTTVGTTCNANLVPEVDPYAGPHNQNQWLNPAAFSNPAVATVDTSPTDFTPLGSRALLLRAPGLYNLDFSLRKNFGLPHRMQLQFRGEAFNILNNVNFGAPGQLDFTNLSNFSRITKLNGSPRILQLAAKLYY